MSDEKPTGEHATIIIGLDGCSHAEAEVRALVDAVCAVVAEMTEGTPLTGEVSGRIWGFKNDLSRDPQ